MISEIISPVVTRYMSHINYTSIALLMTIESSFIPFPSEIIIPPAWWKAAQWTLNSFAVIGFSILGSLLWALINYFLALRLWRKVIHRLARTKRAHMIFINEESLNKSEKYFKNHGKISTFVGRLIPWIRQLISLPAGIAKMDMFHFITYTILGAGIWNVILFITGYVLGQHREKVKEYNHIFTQAILWIIIIMIVFFWIRYVIKQKKSIIKK